MRDGLVDNPQTLLEAVDLVFFDPVETGFSRPAKPEFASEFLSTLGDFDASLLEYRGGSGLIGRVSRCSPAAAQLLLVQGKVTAHFRKSQEITIRGVHDGAMRECHRGDLRIGDQVARSSSC
jgi:hypothetical protein